jgi:Flp pilus assembly protein TadG
MIRRLVHRLSSNERGAAAAEMALIMPLLLVLMMGSVELGNYFLDEHVLVKAVRDGARYAARQSFTNYNGCSTTATDLPTRGVAGSAYENTKLIVQKGSLDTADDDLLPNWSEGDTTFIVQLTCSNTVGTTGMSGIYAGNIVGTDNAAPVVIVTASLPYRTVLSSFGFTGQGYSLNASQQASVTGI